MKKQKVDKKKNPKVKTSKIKTPKVMPDVSEYIQLYKEKHYAIRDSPAFSGSDFDGI